MNRFPVKADPEHRRRIALLIAVAVVSIALWQTPDGNMLLYPFTLLSTWFHEMGHGIAAMLVGSRFDHLVIFADGSGYAMILRPGDAWRLTNALISASGPLGPAVVGALLLTSSRTDRGAGRALATLGVALLLSAMIWIRSWTGWASIPPMGMALLAVAAYGSASVKRIVVQIVGVQACIGAWRQFDYLFSSGGSVGGMLHRSDTGAMEDALLLPYWFWGGVVSAAIAGLLWWSLRASLRR